MSAELKNCPFCGSKFISRGRTGHSAWVECDGCGAQTAFTETVVEAVKNWNARFLTGGELREIHSFELRKLRLELEGLRASGQVPE